MRYRECRPKLSGVGGWESEYLMGVWVRIERRGAGGRVVGNASDDGIGVSIRAPMCYARAIFGVYTSVVLLQ